MGLARFANHFCSTKQNACFVENKEMGYQEVKVVIQTFRNRSPIITILLGDQANFGRL